MAFMTWANIIHNPCLSDKGADLTMEADSGYSPMALAVALGHKKGWYHYRSEQFRIVAYKKKTLFLILFMCFGSPEGVG